MANTYTLISSNVLSSSAASVTFSAIPATYTDLVVRCSVRSARSANFYSLKLIINGTTTSVYSRTYLNDGGGTPLSGRSAATTQSLTYESINADTSTASTFANVEYYIPNYTSSSNKPTSYFGAGETNASVASLTAQANLVQIASAITSLEFSFPDASNIVSGSSFYLYGIKNS